MFGAAQNRSHRRLSDFTDTIGNRVSGSDNLEKAINYMYKAMTQDGLDVHLGEYVFLFFLLDVVRRHHFHKFEVSFVSSAECHISFVSTPFYRASQNPTLGERERECRNDFAKSQKTGYTGTG